MHTAGHSEEEFVLVGTSLHAVLPLARGLGIS